MKGFFAILIVDSKILKVRHFSLFRNGQILDRVLDLKIELEVEIYFHLSSHVRELQVVVCLLV